MKVHLDRARVDLAPGGSVTLAVTVHNDGRHAVTPDLRVTGLDEAGVTGAAVLPPVAPGGSWTSQLTLRLPPSAPAAARRVAVVAHDRSGRAEAAAAHLEVVTGSAARVAMRLSPRDVRGRMGSRFAVHLDNQGDTTVELALTGEAEGLRLRLRPRTVTLPPGAFVRVRGRVRSRRPALARSRRRPFLVRAQGTTTPVEEAGSLHQHTLLDGVLLKAVAVLVVLGLWAGGALAAVRVLGGPTEVAGPVTTTTTTLPDPSTDPGGAGGAAGGGAGGDAAGAGGDGAAGGGVAGGDAAGAPAASVTTVAGGAGAGAGGDGADGGAAVRAAVSGSVSGPAQLGGIEVSIEQVVLGDQAAQGGKLLASSVAPRTAAVSGQRTTTDDGGRFRFASGLEVPALYRVTAVKPGFEVASVVAELTTNAPSVDLAIALQAATGRLAGRVIGPDGVPVGDATVTVSSAAVTYTTAVASDGDARGTWAIEGVATPGSYVVAVVSAGFASASTVVTLSGGESRAGVDLALVAGAGTIRGQVSSRGSGVGGVTVTAQQVGGEVRRSTTTLTQAGLVGRFELPGLPLGRYTLTVEGAGWLTETSQVVLDQGDLAVTLSDLRLATATVQGRVLQQALITPACAYPGANYDPATVRPQPCGNVGVTVANLGGTWRTTTAGTDGGFVVSGIPAGTYTVTFERYGYVPATATVTVAAGDVVDVGPSGPTGVEPVVLELVAAPGQGLAVVQSVVRDQTDPTDDLDVHCLLVRITVTDGTGSAAAPLLDAVAMPDQCPAAGLSAPSDPATSYVLPCASVANGTGVRACWLTGGGIRILGLVAGAKQLRVAALGFDATTQLVQVPLGGTVELGVILLQPLATLTGMVLGPNDAPLASARIMVAPVDQTLALPDPPPSPEGGWGRCEYLRPAVGAAPAVLLDGLCVETGPNGDYRFGQALPTGQYDLIAPVDTPTGWTAPAAVPLDHELRVRTVETRAGSVTNQDIVLRRYGAVYGVVQTPQASGGFGFVDTPTIRVTGRTDGRTYCQSPPGPTAPDGPFPCRISRPGTGGYRIDRLRELAGGYDITFDKTDGAVVYQTRTETVDGGVTFNTELLRNQIMTVPSWGVSGSVTWRAGPSSVLAVGDVDVDVTGVTAYQVLALPPFREATVVTVRSRTTAGTGAFATASPASPFVSPTATLAIATAGFQPYQATVARAATTTPVGAIELEPLAQTLNGQLTLSPVRVTSGPLVDIVTDADVFAGLTATAESRLTGQRTVTNVTATGSFAMPGLRPGYYTVTVSGPGVDPLTIDADPGTAGVQDVLLNVGAGGGVEATGAVSRHGRLRVRVTEFDGDPAVGVNVVLKQGGTVLRTATTCVDPTAVGGRADCPAGTVLFDGLTPAGASWAFTVTATKDGWVPRPDVAVDLATVRSQEVAVAGLEQYGWITGTVMARNSAGDANPVPLAGATVSTGGVSAVTGTDGRFSLVGTLPAGSYTLAVSAGGYTAITQAVTVANRAETPAGSLVLTALPATLSGTVTNGVDNLAFAGVSVSVIGLGLTTATASDGGYSVTLPPGVHSVEFSAGDGRPSVTRVISLAPGATVDLDITMSGPTGTVFGIVSSTDATGATSPLDGASVTWTPAGGAASPAVTTGSSGSYTFPNVPAGVAVTVSVSRSGYDTATSTVTVQANQSVYLPLTLVSQSRTMTATVRGAGNAPLAGVTVTATGMGTTVSGVTAADGMVDLGLRTGQWTLTTSGASAVTHYDATSGATGSVSYQMPRPGQNLPAAPVLTLSSWEGVQVVLKGRANALEASPATVDLTTGTHGATVSATVNGVPVTLNEVAGTPGTYLAKGPWGPVTYSLQLTAVGYVDLPVTGLALTANTTVSSTRTLTAVTRSVVVTASSAQGGALGGVAVDAVLVGSTVYATGTTAADGTVTLTLPASANWRLTTRQAATATIGALGTVPHADVSAVALAVPVATTATPPAVTAALTLTPAAANLTGAITSTFQSALMTGSSQAVVGATVTAALGSWTRTTGVLAGSTYTLPVWQAQDWSVTGALAAHTAPAAQLVDVGAGGATANLAFTRRAATLAGTVTDATTAGVADVVVTVRRHGNATVLATTTTDAQGDYAVADLDPVETYDVTFDPSGLLTSLMRQPVTYTTAATTAGNDIALDHQLSAQAGTLTVAVIGRLQGQTTIAHAMAVAPTVTLSNPGTIDALAVTMTSDGSGGWTGSVAGLPTSTTYAVRVVPPTGWGTTAGAAGPIDQTGLSVTAAGPNATTVTLSPLPQALAVTLRMADGSPYVGPASPTPLLKGGGIGAGGQSASAGVNGVFTFTAVPVSPTGAAAYTIDLPNSATFVGGTLPGFHLAQGDTTWSHDLQRLSATVTARANVNSNPAAVSDATVSVTVTRPTGGTSTHAFVAPAGAVTTYRIDGVLANRAPEVTVSRTGSTTATQTPDATFPVNDAPTLSFALVLAQVSHTFTVTSSGGAALAGGQIVATPATTGTPVRTSTFSGTSPHASTLSLEPGSWSLAVSATDHVTKTVSITVPAGGGGSSATTLSHERAGRLLITSSTSGFTLTGIDVAYTSAPTVSIGTATPVALRLVAGTYQVNASADGHAPLTNHSFTVTEGSTTQDVTITLNRYESLTVTVTDGGNLIDDAVGRVRSNGVWYTLVHDGVAGSGRYVATGPFSGQTLRVEIENSDASASFQDNSLGSAFTADEQRTIAVTLA